MRKGQIVKQGREVDVQTNNRQTDNIDPPTGHYVIGQLTTLGVVRIWGGRRLEMPGGHDVTEREGSSNMIESRILCFFISSGSGSSVACAPASMIMLPDVLYFGFRTP